MLPGAKSLDELKDRFLHHYQNGDAAAMMALYYQNGASPRMRNLYSASLPNRDHQRISEARIGDIGGDYWPGRDPYTLKPEKVLLVSYGGKNKRGLSAVGQWFFLGRHKGRWYLTLPTGKNRPKLQPTMAAFRSLVKEIAGILSSEIPKLLENKKWRLKDKEWKTVYIDQRWTKDGGTAISKMRVILASGQIFARLDAPRPVAEMMGDIGEIKDRAFEKKWYGMKLFVQPNGRHRIEYDHDPACVVDPRFFEPD
jgi:hypothetical protein